MLTRTLYVVVGRLLCRQKESIKYYQIMRTGRLRKMNGFWKSLSFIGNECKMRNALMEYLQEEGFKCQLEDGIVIFDYNESHYSTHSRYMMVLQNVKYAIKRVRRITKHSNSRIKHSQLTKRIRMWKTIVKCLLLMIV